MRRFRVHNTFAALDVGTSKVACFVGRCDGRDGIEVLGMGVVPSEGMRSGAVSSVGVAAECIRASIAEAEASSNARVRSVVAGIAGGEVKSRPFQSELALGERSREIVPRDIIRLREKIRASTISGDEVLLHIEPQEYVIDGRTVSANPLGMWGIRIELNSLVVTASLAWVNNLRRSIQLAGVATTDLVLEPLASADAVFDDDERMLGAALIDMGGGTSDVALFQRGAIRSSVVISLGGELVTRDLAMVLRAPMSAAEDLKVRVGLVHTALGDEEETVEVAGIGETPTRTIPVSLVGEIIRARIEEILEQVAAVLDAKTFREPLAGGIVLTGGASKMKGLLPLAQRILRMPTRCGYPRRVTGVPELLGSPEHATGMGLLRRASTLYQNSGSGAGSSVPNVWHWLKERWKELG
ncbi:cell division protein FtsA [Candidatus Fermentibacteria bacterium]|nr:cell division protein FtsA [Candidatus Fermentibacteria bacterium]